MDTLSVFSNSIKKIKNQTNIKIDKFIKLLKNYTKKYQIKKKQILFSNLKDWKIKDDKIFDIRKNYFSIFYFNILATLREVKYWSQPLISDHKQAFNAFIIKKKKDDNFYLLKITLEPGLNNAKFTTTINIKNFEAKKKYQDKYYYNYFKNKKNLKKFIYSDEGGRFYQNQSLNCIKEIKSNQNFILKKNFKWVSHNQMIDLINKNLLTIEARNLFACYNIDKII